MGAALLGLLALPGAPGQAAAALLPSRLPDPIARLLAGCGLPAESVGLAIEPLTGEHGLQAWHQADRPFVLASTAKLVTSLAALDLLGPRHRWRTLAFLDGPLGADGVLRGNLLIVGGGNALLRSDELLAWFGDMRTMGLHEVDGQIVVDRLGFRLTPQDLADTPTPAPDRPHHAWPDAMVVDEGRLRLRVQPGSERGEGTGARIAAAAQLSLVPPVDGVLIESALVDGAGCQVSAAWRQPAPGSTLRRLQVRGRWGAGCGERALDLAPPWPGEELTRQVVAALWRRAGGRLRGPVVAGQPRPGDNAWPAGPDGQALQAWSVHRSVVLRDWLRDMNKSSDNLAARNLMLSLAPGFPRQAATLPAARERVQRWLQTQGLRPGDLMVDSGSGLSREERGRPRAMVALLRRAWDGPLHDPFVASLPVAGVDGTLQHRMTRGAAAGRAFLKTGTLLDARALAGYVLGRQGHVYALAAMAQHPEAARATPMLDGVVEWLAAHG